MVSTPTRPQPDKQQAGKPRPGSSAAPAQRPLSAPLRVKAAYRKFWSALEGTGTSKNGSTYYLILGSTLALTAIGIMMVLSASSVESIAAGKSPYGDALKQGGFAAIGIFTMFVLSRINVVWLKRLAWLAIIAAVVLLGLVQIVGAEVNGNKNWIDLGGITFQPSEASKLALALWMATVLAMKGKLLSRWQHVAIPAVPMAIIIVGLVLVGNDLGTAMIIMMITAAALFFAGAPLYLFGIAGLVAAAGTLSWLSPVQTGCAASPPGGPDRSCADGIDANYQATNGLYGLASGGWFGVGLGQSRQKYSWIPEAHNDFIFAIIGEELGLVGTVVVLVLFAILGIAIYRVVVAQEDVPPRPGRHHHGVAARPGDGEHVRGDRPDARDRCAAAVHFLRRVRPADVALRHRRGALAGPGADGPGHPAQTDAEVQSEAGQGNRTQEKDCKKACLTPDDLHEPINRPGLGRRNRRPHQPAPGHRRQPSVQPPRGRHPRRRNPGGHGNPAGSRRRR
jgi:cell division protein FtsW